MLTKMVQTETIGFGKGHFCLDMNPVFFFYYYYYFLYIYHEYVYRSDCGQVCD